jgi:hypothetical protein
MKAFYSMTALQNGARRIPMGLIVAAAIFLQHNAMANPAMVNLGSDSSFAVLAGSLISDAGAMSTITTGNVGLSPTTGAAIGLTAGQVESGTIYAVDAAGPAGSVDDPGLLTTAKADLNTAFGDASGRSGTAIAGSDNQLGGQTLIAGVYSITAASTANLIGTLTLDGQGNPNAVFIIQCSSTLVTASDSLVKLIGDAQACHVFWVVDSNATLGTGTEFVGNILAWDNIWLDTGATVDGRLLAYTDQVTLEDNTITEAVCNASSNVPDTGSTLLLLGFGLATLLAFKRDQSFAAFHSVK